MVIATALRMINISSSGNQTPEQAKRMNKEFWWKMNLDFWQHGTAIISVPGSSVITANL